MTDSLNLRPIFSDRDNDGVSSFFFTQNFPTHSEELTLLAPCLTLETPLFQLLDNSGSETTQGYQMWPEYPSEVHGAGSWKYRNNAGCSLNQHERTRPYYGVIYPLPELDWWSINVRRTAPRAQLTSMPLPARWVSQVAIWRGPHSNSHFLKRAWLA
jgi:hypothetical protein